MGWGIGWNYETDERRDAEDAEKRRGKNAKHPAFSLRNSAFFATLRFCLFQFCKSVTTRFAENFKVLSGVWRNL